jgi:hypothetical protein
MPVYYFHTQTDTRFTDDVGTDCLDAAAARREAVRTFGEIMRDAPEPFWGSRPWKVTVTDAAGLIFWELSMDGEASSSAPA